MTFRSNDPVPREAAAQLAHLTAMIVAEARHQNLIAASTIADFEQRHIRDSLQLVPLLGEGPVIDIGSGAGLPGLVLAITMPVPIYLVEPRRQRADFLKCAASALGLANVVVVQSKAERFLGQTAPNITARAVASLDQLFNAANHLSTPSTRWVLPKGRSAESELATAKLSWQGHFQLVQSRTDDEAYIVLAEGVRRREG